LRYTFYNNKNNGIGLIIIIIISLPMFLV